MLSAVFARPELWHIIALSLSVSIAATAAAAVVGLPLGVMLAIWRFPGRRALIVIANALLGLPPAVVGLGLYLTLSHAGPLGVLDLLFTPAAMIIAQGVLAFPIVAALAHRATEELWSEFGDAMMDLGAGKWSAVPVLIVMGRLHMLTAVLAGFGRTVSEVGAILVVGGNIAGYTRTMTTAIVLETSKGDLPLALGLGLVLIGLTMLISATAFALAGRAAW
ncbi:MAG TPA: ABC transporter permease [Stellaceae bacterium]|jgi:tungstate transport system permease protein|nr:ABC transporter permease [Stellaceae bacterium]